MTCSHFECVPLFVDCKGFIFLLLCPMHVDHFLPAKETKRCPVRGDER